MSDTIQIRGRAFGGVLEDLRVMVDGDGCVVVYDPIAGHYTHVHSLPRRTIATIRRIARGTCRSPAHG